MPVEIFQKVLLMTLPPTFVVSANGRDVPSLDALEEDLCMETFYLPIRVSQDVKNAEVHEAGSNIISDLLKEQRRWMDVRFKWRYLNFPATFPGIYITDTPILTSLYLETILFERHKGPYWANISGISWRTRTVILRGYFAFEVGANQLSRLTSCSFDFHYEHPDSPVARTCLALLKVSPNLRFLVCQSGLDDTFGTTLEEFAREHNGSAVDHDLESLEIIALKNSAAVVERLRLPSLKRLVYEDGVGTAARTIFDLIRRSDLPLTYLQLRSGIVDEVTLVNVLRLLPTLEDLHLSGFTVSAQFLRALDVKNEGSTPPPAPSEDKSLICPHLRSLRLQWLVPQELETCTNALFSLIQSCHVHRSFYNAHLSHTSGVIALPLTDSDHDNLRQELQRRGSVFLRGNDS
ncbi:hypothetical protein A7U60_g2874 [Sanghuangporus baumii]|uniref:Uncharacterized protein n=1 Tax=Sanghuangporus baumii TaxID=108892 RepID=A0A9Q5I1J0_SANBA|nr:hypothetical protein A7U60_g2874 [Sanghuangporus baumii]